MAFTAAHRRILEEMMRDSQCPKCNGMDSDASASPKGESVKLYCKRCSHSWVEKVA